MNFDKTAARTKLERIIYSKRFLFFLGLLLSLGVTLLKLNNGRLGNLMIFRNSTIDFWNGVSPYGTDWTVRQGLDYFLYGPLFNILFTPFAYMPLWLSGLTWNLGNYILFYLSIFSLPERFSFRSKCYIFLFLVLILATTQMGFQYNVTVCYLFLFAFSLLERGHGGWAVLLIMLSGFTKVYGIFQLGLLVCYPKFWRNMGYALLFGVIFLLLPALAMPIEHLPDYYHSWVEGLSVHKDTRTWKTIFYLRPFFLAAPSYMMYIQASSLTLLAALLLLRKKFYGSFAFRAGVIGLLMGWVILFSNSAESHTYLIALAGFLLWYNTRRHTLFDRILLWANLIVLVLVPIDVFCPARVCHYLFETLTLNLWIFAITWLRMCYTLLIAPARSQSEMLAQQ